jgi:hypothetical protein
VRINVTLPDQAKAKLDLSEQTKHEQRFSVLSQLVSRINQWTMETRGVTLEEAPAIAITLKPNETLPAAIEAVRSEIKTVCERLGAVKAAPLPRSEQAKAAEAFVVSLALTARPNHIGVVRDQLRLMWRDDIITSRTDVLALMCWIQPDAVLAAFDARDRGAADADQRHACQ